MTETSAGPTSADEEYPVLIVGGGPAGLTTALELARRGVTGLLVERRTFTTHYPRAHLLNVRTMETFQDLGIAETIYREGPPEDQWHRVAWYTSLGGPTRLHGLRLGSLPAWGGGADAERYAEASPRRFGNLPQIRLDQVLWERAREAWPEGLRERTELVGLDLGDGGAVATLRDHAAARTYRVRARYVIAADGGRTCADLLGVGVSGPRALVDMTSVHFSADLSDHADDEALLTYFIHPSGGASTLGALLQVGPGRWGKHSPQWSLGIRLDPAEVTDGGRERVLARIREVLGIADLEIEIHAVSKWQYEGVVADRYRVGPVLFAGDAAHRHPPTGGLGLNTAVGDATNLGWKLAAVLTGAATDALLDSYESERRPVAIRNVEHSLRNAGRHGPIAQALGLYDGITIDQGWTEIAVWASDTPEGKARREAVAKAIEHNAEDFSQLNIEAGFSYESGAIIPDGTPIPAHATSATRWEPSARPGSHVPHVWLRDRRGDLVSTSDLVAAVGFTLFVDAADRDSWSAAAEAAQGSANYPMVLIAIGADLLDTSGEWARLRGTDATGALIVRPDRHVAWRVPTAPTDRAAALTDAVTRLLSCRPSSTVPDPAAGLRRIAEAGERLRRGRGAAAHVFTEVDV